MKNLLSVVIPAYKQEKTIEKDLRTIDKVLHQGIPSNFNYEIICVVDGVVDKTYEKAKKVKSKKIKVYKYDLNKGKGFAVRFGMLRSRGDIISFLDAGREIWPSGIMMLMDHMKWYDADIIIGSKRHPASQVEYPLGRKIFSFGYHMATRILFNINVRDTQSGIKIFKRKVLEKILPKLQVERYAMDIEMLAVSHYLGFKRIYEAPIKITYRFDDLTHASTFKNISRMLWDTLVVFYRLKLAKKYDSRLKSS